jgi:hypothetical protein
VCVVLLLFFIFFSYRTLFLDFGVFAFRTYVHTDGRTQSDDDDDSYSFIRLSKWLVRRPSFEALACAY